MSLLRAWEQPGGNTRRLGGKEPSGNTNGAIPFPQRNSRNDSKARERTTPQSLEAEQSTLGAMLLEGEAITRTVELLTADDFYRELHRKIFSVLVEMHDRGQAVDMVTVGEELRKRGQLEEVGGAAYLEALIYSCPSAANVESYAKVVAQKATARNLISVYDTALQRCYDESEDALSIGIQTGEQITPVIERAQSIEQGRDLYSYDGALDTLLSDISWLWEGWIPRGSLTLVAGRPGVGKSTVVMDICKRIITGANWPDGTTPDIESADPFNPEPAKLLWIDTESALGLFRQRLVEWGFPRNHFVFAHGNELEPLRVDNDKDWRWIQQAMRDHRPPLVVIDSLSYAHGGDENSNDWMKFVMRRIADLARDFDTAVIVIHHLNKIPYGVADWPLTLDMIRGASTITAFARSVLGCGTPNKEDPTSHGFMSLKLNIASAPGPLGYTTTSEGPAWGKVPEPYREPKPIEKARAWLLEVLAEGPQLFDDLVKDAEAEDICKKRTLEKAIEDLGIISYKSGNRWYRSLPKDAEVFQAEPEQSPAEPSSEAG